jgi:hypothetical protein
LNSFIIELYDDALLDGIILMLNHILMMIMVWVWPMWLIHTPEGRWSIIWGLYCMWRKWSILINVACHMHDSFASEVLSWPMVRPYRYNLASYVARGGVRCGFIPSEVWRQRTYALHSHAFIEVIFADIVDALKCYTNNCDCSRKWDGIGYTGTIEIYIYKYFCS